MKSLDVVPIEEVDEGMLLEVKRRFDATYPYLSSVTKRSKQTVSELKRLSILEQQAEDDLLVSTNADVSTAYLHNRPAFMQSRALSAAEVGTAMHTIMQHIDIRKESSVADVEKLLTELTGRQLLTTEEAIAVDANAVAQFFQTAIAKRLMKADASGARIAVYVRF